MSSLNPHRVIVLETNEKGWLNKMMSQSDGSYLFEIYGDSGRLYILNDKQFLEVGETLDDLAEW